MNIHQMKLFIEDFRLKQQLIWQRHQRRPTATTRPPIMRSPLHRPIARACEGDVSA